MKDKIAGSYNQATKNTTKVAYNRPELQASFTQQQIATMHHSKANYFMNKKLFFVCLLLLLPALESPAKAGKFFRNFLKPTEKEQIRFYGFGIFGELTGRKYTDHADNGKGGGVYSRLGSDYDLGNKKYRVGWYHSLGIGYGIGPKYIPYMEDLGFTFAYPINRDIEVGATWSFLGIYSYSHYANFGSLYSLLFRYRFVQMELAKQNPGIFTGCFFSGEKIPFYSATASLLLPGNFIISARALSGNTNVKHIDKFTEYRLSIGLAF